MRESTTWLPVRGGGKITNIPTKVFQGEQYFEGPVSLRISEIGEYMERNGLHDVDYQEYINNKQGQ